MKLFTGIVVGGRIEVPEDLVTEGAQVIVLAPESGGAIVLSAAEEQELLEAMEEIRRGECVDGDELFPV
jgi:dihydrodipicolinate synthase/N-acetylneuraminate lyase